MYPTLISSGYYAPPPPAAPSSRFGAWDWGRAKEAAVFALAFPVLITACFVLMLMPWVDAAQRSP